MAKPKPGVHALKTLVRANRVKYVSVAFDHATAASIVEDFRDRLKDKLVDQVRTRQGSRFEIASIPGRLDWFVIFKSSYLESDLDVILREVADELGAVLFTEPGILETERNPGNNSEFRFSRPQE